MTAMRTWIDPVCNENKDLIFEYDSWALFSSVKYDEFLKILREEFPDSTVTTLVDRSFATYPVIIFENAEDTLAFRLRYGHLYEKKI